MSDEEQKKIFSKNLNRYILESGKQQNEVAKELGYAATTFNTWCVGKIIPGMGKVQRIADYFGIGKSDLLDDKDDLQNIANEMSSLKNNRNVQLLVELTSRMDEEQLKKVLSYCRFVKNEKKED